MSPSLFTDQWTVSAGTQEGHKIQSARRLDRFLINLGHDRTNSVIWLSFYSDSNTPNQNFQNSKSFLFQIGFSQNSK